MRPPNKFVLLLVIAGEWAIKTRVAVAKFRYRRLGGRCYACPGSYGRHKFSCSVGIKEASLDRD